jgi:hypothetical protein
MHTYIHTYRDVWLDDHTTAFFFYEFRPKYPRSPIHTGADRLVHTYTQQHTVICIHAYIQPVTYMYEPSRHAHANFISLTTKPLPNSAANTNYDTLTMTTDTTTPNCNSRQQWQAYFLSVCECCQMWQWFLVRGIKWAWAWAWAWATT